MATELFEFKVGRCPTIDPERIEAAKLFSERQGKRAGDVSFKEGMRILDVLLDKSAKFEKVAPGAKIGGGEIVVPLELSLTPSVLLSYNMHLVLWGVPRVFTENFLRFLMIHNDLAGNWNSVKRVWQTQQFVCTLPWPKDYLPQEPRVEDKRVFYIDDNVHHLWDMKQIPDFIFEWLLVSDENDDKVKNFMKIHAHGQDAYKRADKILSKKWTETPVNQIHYSILSHYVEALISPDTHEIYFEEFKRAVVKIGHAFIRQNLKLASTAPLDLELIQKWMAAKMYGTRREHTELNALFTEMNKRAIEFIKINIEPNQWDKIFSELENLSPEMFTSHRALLQEQVVSQGFTTLQNPEFPATSKHLTLAQQNARAPRSLGRSHWFVNRKEFMMMHDNFKLLLYPLLTFDFHTSTLEYDMLSNPYPHTFESTLLQEFVTLDQTKAVIPAPYVHLFQSILQDSKRQDRMQIRKLLEEVWPEVKDDPTKSKSAQKARDLKIQVMHYLLTNLWKDDEYVARVLGNPIPDSNGKEVYKKEDNMMIAKARLKYLGLPSALNPIPSTKFDSTITFLDTLSDVVVYGETHEPVGGEDISERPSPTMPSTYQPPMKSGGQSPMGEEERVEWNELLKLEMEGRRLVNQLLVNSNVYGRLLVETQETLLDSLTEARRLNEQLKKQIEEQRIQMREEGQMNSQLSALLNSYVNMMNRHEELKHASVEDAKRQQAMYDQAMEASNRKIESVTKERANLQTLMHEQGLKIEESQRQVTTINEKIQRLTAKNKELQGVNETLQSELISLQKILDTAQQEREILKSQVGLKTQQIEELKANLNRAIERKRTYVEMIESSDPSKRPKVDDDLEKIRKAIKGIDPIPSGFEWSKELIASASNTSEFGKLFEIESVRRLIIETTLPQEDRDREFVLSIMNSVAEIKIDQEGVLNFSDISNKVRVKLNRDNSVGSPAWRSNWLAQAVKMIDRALYDQVFKRDANLVVGNSLRQLYAAQNTFVNMSISGDYLIPKLLISRSIRIKSEPWQNADFGLLLDLPEGTYPWMTHAVSIMVHFDTLRFNDPNFQFVETMRSTYTDHGPMIDALIVSFNNLSIVSPNDPAMSILKDIISQYSNDPDSKEFNDLNEMAKMMTSDDDELIVKEIDNFFEEINPGMKTGDMVTLSMTADFGDYLLPLLFFHSYFVAQSISESTPVTMDTSQPPTS